MRIANVRYLYQFRRDKNCSHWLISCNALDRTGANVHGVVATTIAWAPATRWLGADLCGPRHGSREVRPNEGGGRWVGGIWQAAEATAHRKEKQRGVRGAQGTEVGPRMLGYGDRRD